MSNMVECDGCKKKMYTDSRSNKGDFHEIWVDHSYQFHLCRECWRKFLTDILKDDLKEWGEGT